MNINAIHIGCWYSVNSKVGKAICVNTTIKNGVKLDGIHSCSADCIKPIPLTEGILKANGFEQGFYYRLDIDDCSVEVCLDATLPMYIIDTHGWQLCYARSKYVHELQHNLRDAGLDDLADNFKVS